MSKRYQKESSLARTISLKVAISIGVGIMVGAGIFVFPGIQSITTNLNLRIET